MVNRCLCNSTIFVSNNMAAIFFESVTRTRLLRFGELTKPSNRPKLKSFFNCFCDDDVVVVVVADIGNKSYVLLSPLLLLSTSDLSITGENVVTFKSVLIVGGVVVALVIVLVDDNNLEGK